jgi:hypothetical protein
MNQSSSAIASSFASQLVCLSPQLGSPEGPAAKSQWFDRGTGLSLALPSLQPREVRAFAGALPTPRKRSPLAP